MATTHVTVEPRFLRDLSLLAFNPDDVLSVSWELVEAGGAAQATVTFAKPFDSLATLPAGGDTLEIWAFGTGETVPRFRGIVGQPEAALDMAETRTVIAYGRAEDMNHVLLDEVMLIPGGGDLSAFASRIADAYQDVRGATFARDLRTTGVTMERLEFEHASAREGMDQLLAQAPGVLVWGWDIDPATGQDRLYLRPRTASVGHQFFVGDTVKLLHEPKEFQGLKNAVLLRGGPAKYPNLLAQATGGNTSFERPELSAESNGNLLLDAGFEDRSSNWTLSGGASFKVGSLSEGAPHGGEDMVELDAAAEAVEQTRAVSVTVGHTYVIGSYLRRETGGSAVSVRITGAFLDNADAVLASSTPDVSPESAVWDRHSLTLVCPSGATKVKLRVEHLSGAGCMVDDTFFYDRDAIRSEGWQTKSYGAPGNVDSIDWAYPLAQHGKHSVFIAVTANDVDNQDVHLEPLSQARFAVVGNQEVRFTAQMRLAPNVTTHGIVRLELHWFDQGGSEIGTSVETPIAANTLTSSWTLQSTTGTAPSNAASCLAYVNFRGNSAGLLIDALCVRDAAAGTEFLEAENFERYVTAEEVCTSGTDAYNSFATYGRREGVVENADIVRWSAESQAWLKAWFEKYAVPVSRPRLALVHEPTRQVSPGEGTQVRVSGLARAVPDFWPARVGYQAAGGLIGIEIELGDERPSLERLLRGAEAGSGSVSGTRTTGSGGGGSAPIPPSGGMSIHGDSLHDATVASLDGGGQVPAAELGSGTVRADLVLVGDNGSGSRVWNVPPANYSYQAQSSGNVNPLYGIAHLRVHETNGDVIPEFGTANGANLVYVKNRRGDQAAMSVTPSANDTFPEGSFSLAFNEAALLGAVPKSPGPGYNVFRLPLGLPVAASDNPLVSKREMQVLANAGAATLSTVGIAVAPTTTGTITSGDTSYSPFVQAQAGAAAGNTAGITTAYNLLRREWSAEMVLEMMTGPYINNTVRYWAGLFSGDPSGSATPAVHLAALRFDGVTDSTAFWRCVTAAGTSTQTVTTVSAVAASTRYRLRIVCSASDVKFYIDGTLVATHTTNLPTAGQGLAAALHVTTIAANGVGNTTKLGRIALLHN